VPFVVWRNSLLGTEPGELAERMGWPYARIMNKAEILQELPKLRSDERQDIFARLCELEERDLLNGVGPTAEEKTLLDREWEDYRKAPDAGSSWEEVEARLLSRGGQ